MQQTSHLVGEILHDALPGYSHVSPAPAGFAGEEQVARPAHWYPEPSRLGLLGFAGNGRVLWVSRRSAGRRGGHSDTR